MPNFLPPPCDEAQIRAAKCRDLVESLHTKRWVLVVAILGSSMAFIDSTVVNVALPVLQSEFRAGIADVQWVIESYALFLTALVLVGGSLGDQIGRRLTFCVGVVIFTAASFWCGLSPGLNSLIVARAFQGVGAALLVPGSLALLSSTFPENERGRAIGTWSGFSGLTAAIGPVLGGWFVQSLSWRWAFFMNIPIGVAVVIIAITTVPESRAPARGRLDWLGAALATLSLTSIVYALLSLPSLGWNSAWVVSLLFAGAAGMATFIVVEAKAQNPMMPVDVFRSKTFSGANVLTFLLYGALSGALFFVPFQLVQVRKYSPLQAGSALLPFVLIMFLLSRWAGGLVTRFGARWPLTLGPLVTAIGFALFSVPTFGDSYWKTVFPAVTILGLGMVTTVAPLTTTVMESVSAQRAGAASGINNAVARLAGLLAIALLGLAIQSAFATNLSKRVAAMDLAAPVEQEIKRQQNKLAAIDMPTSLNAAARLQLQQNINGAFVSAFRRVVLICAALAMASALVGSATISRKRDAVATS
jgi:EmrB/QacA subfamily drug resistance transporter